MKKKWFLMIALGWITAIGGFILAKEITLARGTEVLLKTRPVDPRDLFRGDFVALRYDISSLPLELYQSEVELAKGDMVYVSIQVNEDLTCSPLSIHAEKPSDGIFLKARIRSLKRSRIDLVYGVESYFTPEGKGKVIEHNIGEYYTLVAIDRSGNPVIKRLVHEAELPLKR